MAFTKGQPRPERKNAADACQNCGTRTDTWKTGWGRHCIGCLNIVRYQGSPGFRQRWDAENKAPPAGIAAERRAG